MLQMGIRIFHSVPEPLGVEAGDLVVLPAVVADHFAAAAFERGKRLRPGLNVEGVLGLCLGCEVSGVETGVPVCVVEDDVFKPVLLGVSNWMRW